MFEEICSFFYLEKSEDLFIQHCRSEFWVTALSPLWSASREESAERYQEPHRILGGPESQAGCCSVACSTLTAVGNNSTAHPNTKGTGNYVPQLRTVPTTNCTVAAPVLLTAWQSLTWMSLIGEVCARRQRKPVKQALLFLHGQVRS